MVRPSAPAEAAETPAPGWWLRPARPVDADAWYELQRGIYDEGVAFVGDGAPSAGALAAKLRACDPRDAHVAFAVAAGAGVERRARRFAGALGAPPGGALVGWIELQRLASRRLAHVAWLTLAVAADWRGRGVGGALLSAGHDWARAHGVRKLQLHVRAGNSAAIALYRREGYRLEGVLRGQVARSAAGGAAAGFEDEWVMARTLDPEAT